VNFVKYFERHFIIEIHCKLLVFQKNERVLQNIISGQQMRNALSNETKWWDDC